MKILSLNSLMLIFLFLASCKLYSDDKLKDILNNSVNYGETPKKLFLTYKTGDSRIDFNRKTNQLLGAGELKYSSIDKNRIVYQLKGELPLESVEWKLIPIFQADTLVEIQLDNRYSPVIYSTNHSFKYMKNQFGAPVLTNHIPVNDLEIMTWVNSNLMISIAGIKSKDPEQFRTYDHLKITYSDARYILSKL